MYVALLLAAAITAPPPDPGPTLAPRQLLARIRSQFRSHRPPPPFETYTLERVQLRRDGSPDPAMNYTFRVWVRNSDRAAMKRQVARAAYELAPAFDRPAFNEERDPGPPTADVFEPRPAKPHPVADAYTPEARPSEASVIGHVQAIMELDYRVTKVATEGELIHLTLAPISDPTRNRLREVYADKSTYELKKLVAVDRLYVTGAYTDDYADEFTLTMGTVDGVPVVTQIHGVAGLDDRGSAFEDDGKVMDFFFRDITFPAALPDWYFDPLQYGAHQNELPQ